MMCITDSQSMKQRQHLQSHSQLPEFTVKGPEEVQVETSKVEK